jgi:hypothetical protein
MEYLMTYGWAILIIAIVLVAFFSLNLFNPYTFSPKASPGSCQILRPNGPGSNLFVSEVGLCNTNEIPQYVASFDGVGTYINIGSNSLQLSNIKSTITVSGWIRVKVADYGYNYIFSNDRDCCGPQNGYALGVASLYPRFRVWNSTEHLKVGPIISNNTWYFLTGTFNGSDVTFYLNGVLSAPPLAYSGTIGVPSSYSNYIGALACCPSYYDANGLVSNVQIYNTSLSQPEITALYQEGIGGAPVDIQNLVGWWPLNGNSNDYSGNGNNGVPTGVTFTSNWENGYTAP